MAKRGRVSEAEASTNVIQGNFGERPQPPDDLTESQAGIWQQIVASEPVEFFNTAALRAMLKDFCRHRDAAERISQIINSFEPQWLKAKDGAKRYYELLRMRELETNAASRLATRLRLTNQSRYVPHTASTASRNATKTTPPWEM